MSSASSGRYQSRLFNFVHQRSRRLTENLSRAFRHLQVATSRVAPVVLYPIYLLFQSTRSAGKQMHQAVQQSWPKLPDDDTDSQTKTPLTADTPIQRVHSVPYQAIAFLDRTVADLESNHLAPVSKVAITALSKAFALGKRSWEIVHRVKTQLTVSKSSQVQPFGSKSPALARDATDAHTFRIQALIWAAIDYFFGPKLPSAQLPSRHGSLAEQEFSRQLPPQLVTSDLDPWLTLTDLFGNPESSKGEPATQHMPESSTSQTMSQLGGKTNPALPSSQSPGYSLLNLLNRFQKRFHETKQASGLVSEDEIEPAPDWLETRATAMGYVKHPLEQLLEWLDRAMLWSEELLMRVFQWVRSCMAR